MLVDYIIVGQGLCGTLLSRQLIASGKTVIVIDNGNPNAAARVAGGIINPVTGKRLVRTWLIEQLLPFAAAQYTAIANELNTPLLQPINILDFHPTFENRDIFNERIETEKEYLQHVSDADDWARYFNFNYGIGAINHCLLVDLGSMLAKWREKLVATNSLAVTDFKMEDCVITNDAVTYNGITAQKIIFCDGAACIDNPYFCNLPWSKDKGEVLIADIPGLPRNHIYKQGISIVPWKDGLFWVGASHDWKYTTPHPTPEYRKNVTEQLDYWLKLPYEIVSHTAALRPANFDRKPFIGLHPLHPTIGIFNGMGGKGISLAPYFAKQFCEYLINSNPMIPDVDIKRYEKVLSR